MRFDAVPTVSVNGVAFGMSREKVRSLLGTAAEFYKGKDAVNTTDNFKFCHVAYDENNKCEAIEIFDESEVYVNGSLIFPTDFETAKKVIEDLEEDDDGLISISKSIGIYAPCGDMESIVFGKEGYYSDMGDMV
ncbi:MAG: hypothetical protein ACLVJ4_09730 [Mediterraneibacter sp.]